MPLCSCGALALLATLATVPTLAGGRAASGAANGPAFVPRQRTVVLARVGDSAELSCRVLRLADRTVSWVRSSDLQILTHAGAVFTADSRVSCSENAAAPPELFASSELPPDPGEEQFDVAEEAGDGARGPVTLHVLRIARLRLSDAGRYECQINTEPKMSSFFNLTVVESALPEVVVWPTGRGAVQGVRGGTARLSCGARYEPLAPQAAVALPPLRITWKHAGRDVDPQSTRGGVSLDSERWAGGASSRLTLGGLVAEDSGRYTCSAAGVSATVTLQVAGDESRDFEELGDVVGEMQRDQAAARASAASESGAPGAALALALALALVATVAT